MSTPFRELESEALDGMTPEDRRRFDAALSVEETRLRMAEAAHQDDKAAEGSTDEQGAQ